MGKRHLALFFLLLSNNYFAQHTRLPIMESFYGATSTNATIGNTGLTVGISKYGELVNLRWPCANYFDHLNYKTLYKLPTGWKVEDYNRFYNAGERQGSFAGLKYTLNGKEEITWLRSEAWQQKQGYENVDAPIVVTSYTNIVLGLEVVYTDLVALNLDVLNRHFEIKKITDVGLSNIQLIYVTNVAPCNKKPLFEPSTDWYKDNNNGFRTLYEEMNQVFLSFNPGSLNGFKKIQTQMTSTSEITAFVDRLETQFPFQHSDSTLLTRDIYCVIGCDRKIANKSLYNDETKPHQLPDLRKCNNTLFSVGPTMCVGYYDVDLKTKTTDELTILISFANNSNQALKNLNSTKNNYEKLLSESKTYWKEKLAKATIPAVNDLQMTNTLKRSLINILITSHPQSGGIGSSSSATQPPYTMIWPRDAAVMGFMLDCAGFHDEAEKNSLFFKRTQRQYDGQDCFKPKSGDCYKGTWFQCYYADGSPSWMHDLEIDEVGWGIWMWYSHSLFLSKDKQKDYLLKVKDNIKLAANFLVEFKDPKNNLQKRAKEDDLLWKSQTIIGAATTMMGLKAAISSLKIMDSTDVDIKKYQVRLNELEAATTKVFWKEKTQQFQKAVYGNFGPRGIIIWPTMYLPITDSKMDNHAEALSQQLKPFFNKTDKAKNKEWWYIGKATMAMAYTWKDNPDKLKVVEGYLKKMLTEVITQDTWVFGETPLVRDVFVKENGKEITKRIYDNRVGQPCNIAAAYIYLTAEILYGKNASKLVYSN